LLGPNGVDGGKHSGSLGLTEKTIRGVLNYPAGKGTTTEKRKKKCKQGGGRFTNHLYPTFQKPRTSSQENGQHSKNQVARSDPFCEECNRQIKKKEEESCLENTLQREGIKLLPVKREGSSKLQSSA